jgi:hypothetical protein
MLPPNPDPAIATSWPNPQGIEESRALAAVEPVATLQLWI